VPIDGREALLSDLMRRLSVLAAMASPPPTREQLAALVEPVERGYLAIDALRADGWLVEALNGRLRSPRGSWAPIEQGYAPVPEGSLPDAVPPASFSPEASVEPDRARASTRGGRRSTGQLRARR
jgi:hypothetical protein